MKQYARQHTLAVIKGIVSSVFPGKKENSGEVYERWEDTPDEKFQMTSGKKTKTGTVKQEHTRWSMTADNSDTLVLSDKSYVKTSGTAAIKLPGTAVYHGGIQFTFSME